eukprot:NODE_8078_length_1525_cov_3.892704.p1 GENE.NODE_8078_length_1525_cov_3.892704~~NODE_8078_length_1525_cov_3.892704.p1  ORF type:complete len:195 (-),score=22.63 NODE_8078_length_1525_cov_3.892704:398-982(-)
MQSLNWRFEVSSGKSFDGCAGAGVMGCRCLRGSHGRSHLRRSWAANGASRQPERARGGQPRRVEPQVPAAMAPAAMHPAVVGSEDMALRHHPGVHPAGGTIQVNMRMGGNSATLGYTLPSPPYVAHSMYESHLAIRAACPSQRAWCSNAGCSAMCSLTCAPAMASARWLPTPCCSPSSPRTMHVAVGYPTTLVT